MFTGIIEGLGKITFLKTLRLGYKLGISSNFELKNFSEGDSISVDGICLTANKIEKNFFYSDVSLETIKTTSLKCAKIGDLVNLERALKLSSRLDGHIVSGHVDGTASISYKKKIGNSVLIKFSTNKSILQFIILKGSISIDGISLTINSHNSHSFEVCIIPHTLIKTTLNNKKIGDLVNIETDILGKYVEKFIKRNISTPNINKKKIIKNIDMNFLFKNGFS